MRNPQDEGDTAGGTIPERAPGPGDRGRQWNPSNRVAGLRRARAGAAAAGRAALGDTGRGDEAVRVRDARRSDFELGRVEGPQGFAVEGQAELGGLLHEEGSSSIL